MIIMGIRILPTVFNFLLIGMLAAACDSSDDGSSDPGLPSEENTIAKYSLTFRGQTSTWTDEDPGDAHFSLHHGPAETEGYYTIGIAMTNKTASSSQSSGVVFTG